MDSGTRLGIALAAAAIGLAIFTPFVPYEWPNIPTVIRRGCLVFGFVVFIVAVPTLQVVAAS
jgi:hypothetical protein